VAVFCGKLFTISGNSLRQRNRRKATGFCSKSCSGKYGNCVRRGLVKSLTNSIEFDKVYYKQKSALGEILNVESQNIGEALTCNDDGNTEA